MFDVVEPAFTKWVDELMGIVRPEDPQWSHSYVVSNGNARAQYFAVVSVLTPNAARRSH